ncbi:HAD family hydrolase [Mangrovicella endophytica]|uniref:HAD family hydrolase n=1 Tax=Mangrovicella endophytica TaxID=2066697 RepID=UPI0018E45B3B|nr:HAD family hydrolase [Mangrovicella endophytica]
MAMPIRLVCLDADDTLWHNETFFREAFRRFGEILSPYAAAEEATRVLDAVEHRNLPLYGYGVKGFGLSMIEAATELAGPNLSSHAVAEILALGRDMMRHPVEMLPGVPGALDRLARQAQLVLVTKGDLFHQETKLAASGLGDRFTGVEIVSDKRAETYTRVFARYGAAPEAAVMAGNSLRSDVLPALEAGAYAAFIPYEIVWAHEAAEAPTHHPRYRELPRLDALPDWVESIG